MSELVEEQLEGTLGFSPQECGIHTLVKIPCPNQLLRDFIRVYSRMDFYVSKAHDNRQQAFLK